MASAFSHILVALALGQAQPWKGRPIRFWGLSLLCSLLPDVDVVGFAVGIPYEHLLGHRRLTHSLSPWTPIKVSPIGISEFFTAYGMKVLVSELVWVGIPVGVGLIGLTLFRGRLKSKTSR